MTYGASLTFRFTASPIAIPILSLLAAMDPSVPCSSAVSNVFTAAAGSWFIAPGVAGKAGIAALVDGFRRGVIASFGPLKREF